MLDIESWDSDGANPRVSLTDLQDHPCDPVFLYGFVKWDGCTQFWMGEDTPHHFDDGFKSMIELFAELRRLTAKLMLPEDIENYWG